MILKRGTVGRANRPQRATERRISHDGRDHQSSRCATSVPEGEQTERRVFAAMNCAGCVAGRAQIAEFWQCLFRSGAGRLARPSDTSLPDPGALAWLSAAAGKRKPKLFCLASRGRNVRADRCGWLRGSRGCPGHRLHADSARSAWASRMKRVAPTERKKSSARRSWSSASAVRPALTSC
jgi:hypothetical protein